MSDEVGKRLATLGALLELEEAVAQGDLKAAQPCRDKRLILAGDLFIRDRKRHGFRIWAGTANVQALVGDYNRDGYADIAITGGLGWFTIPCALSKGDGTFLVHNDNTTSIRSGNDLRRQVRTLPCGRWATFAESIERSGLGLEPGRPRQTYQSGSTTWSSGRFKQSRICSESDGEGQAYGDFSRKWCPRIRRAWPLRVEVIG